MDFTRVSQSIGVVPEEEEKKYASRNIDFSKVTSSLLDAPEEGKRSAALVVIFCMACFKVQTRPLQCLVERSCWRVALMHRKA